MHARYIILTIFWTTTTTKPYRYLALHNWQVGNPCNLPRPWPAKSSTRESALAPLSTKEALHCRTITPNKGEAHVWKFFLLASLPLLFPSSEQQSWWSWIHLFTGTDGGHVSHGDSVLALPTARHLCPVTWAYPSGTHYWCTWIGSAQYGEGPTR
jgi:hypothetical protein